MRAKIIGTGRYLPEKKATNEYLSTFIDTTDEWISNRTGIRSRHLVEHETTVSMAVKAAESALTDAGVKGSDIELIIVATVSADHLVPSTGCMVQKELKATGAVAFDINAACSGFLFALNLADAYFQSGLYKNALLIGVETLSRMVNWADRSTCVLFGDGAGAAVACASPIGLCASIQGSDGTGGEYLLCKSRTNNNPYISTTNDLDYLYMNGQEVFKFAIKKVPECIFGVLEKAGLTTEDIDCYVLHQANLRIIGAIAKRLKLPVERFPSNVEQYGNTSAASVPILLDELNKDGQLKPGDRVLMAGFGAGLTWGAAIMIW